LSKQNLILHIGRHKCGTSALQQYLNRSCQTLISKSICYPITGRGKKVAHHELANLLNPKRGIKANLIIQTKNKFEKEVENYETIILSSEAFSNIQNTKLVKEFFSNFQITTVCYYREILDYFVSAYSQRIQATNYASTFDQFNITTSISYQTFEDRWVQISDNYIKRYFHRPYLYNSDIVHDFFQVIKVELVDNGNFDSVNKSIGGNLLYSKILINKLELNHNNLYNKLGKLAQSNKDFSNAFYISKGNAIKYRKMHRLNNKFLENTYKDIHYKSFINKPLCPNEATLQRDLEFFKTFGLISDSAKIWAVHTKFNF